MKGDLRIVHIIWSLGFGGIETMLVNIANAQAASGAHVSVMIINDSWEKPLFEGFDERVNKLLVHKRAGSGNPLFLIKLNRMLKKENPDIIHAHGSDLWALLVPSLRRKMVSTLHDVPHGVIRRKGLIYRMLPILDQKQVSNVKNIDKVNQVFAISQAVHDELKANYGVESKVVVNGIPTASFRQRGKREAGKPLRIVMISRIVHEKKGQDLLIEAVAALKGKATADFIGIGESMDWLKQLARDLKAEKWITFLGKKSQKEIKQMLADYDLFAQPSRFEGFGLTVAEAMSAGVPVLVSEGQGPSEVTCGNQYGWTFRNGDSSDLKAKIAYIIDNYEEALDKAEKAINHVRNTYDVSITAKTYINEYQKDI